MISRDVDFADMQSRLVAWLQQKMPQAQNILISDIERSGAGLSNETFLFNLSWQEAGQQRSEGMVLRCPPREYPVYPDYNLSNQFRTIESLHKAIIPVPQIYWLEMVPVMSERYKRRVRLLLIRPIQDLFLYHLEFLAVKFL